MLSKQVIFFPDLVQTSLWKIGAQIESTQSNLQPKLDRFKISQSKKIKQKVIRSSTVQHLVGDRSIPTNIEIHAYWSSTTPEKKRAYQG